jgi:PAS domain S-box-containing protein
MKSNPSIGKIGSAVGSWFSQCRKMEHRSIRPALLVAPLLIQLLLPGRASALDPARDLKQYNCQTWSRQNGLPANGITAITQTRDGYLWLGTSAGLVRFNGIEFKLLDLSSVTNLTGSIVTSLASARNGGIWAGLDHSSFGFCDGRSFSFRGQPAWGGMGMNVRSIVESEDGTLWFAAAEFGTTRLTRPGTFEPLTVPGSPTNGALNALCCYEDRQGRIWFGTANQGLYYWQAGKMIKVADPTLDAALIFCIAEDHEGQIWCGTVDGLHCFDSNLQPKATLPLDHEVRALLVDDHDVLWIGTAGVGLGRYRNGTSEFLQRADGLGSDYVNALAEDREGSLWIGTRGGVSQLTDVKFPTQPAAENQRVKDALAVCASHQGGVWIGSPRGVTYFDPATGTRKTYGSETGIPSSYIKRVFEASNGDLYLVCFMKTLAILSPEKKLLAVYTNSDLVVGMAEDAHGVVVSVAGELYRAGTNYFQPYAFTNAEQPPMNWIVNLASGRDGVIWVASVNGIFRVKDGAYKQWSAAEGLADPNVQTVCEDQDGVVWAGLLSGIARLKDNQIRLISRKDGLLDNNIYAVVPDDFGNLWVDSVRGIFSVSRQSMNDFADGKTARVQCMVFDGMDSVKLSDKSQQERVACKTSDGRIWFPSANGVVMIDPAHITTNRVAPQVNIDLVKADGQEVARSEAITVPPGKGELEFDFNASTFIAPQKTSFRYRLQGYENDWVDAGNRRLAFYTNLKPGAYTFQVIAANADGVWNERGDTLNVELRPHYYQTAWFRLLCGGLAFAALIGIYLLRVRRLNLKQQALQKSRDLLESEVQKRTAELAKTNAALQEKIAERKQVEMALLESQALYQSLVTQMPVGLFRKDREGRFVAANPVFCRLKGFSAEEILGKTPEELDDYERTKEAVGLLKQPPRQRILAAQGEEHHNRIMRTGETIEVDEAYPQPDGTVEYFHVVKTPVFDAQGRVIGSQGVQFDITERRRMEEALRGSQEEFKDLFDNAPVGFHEIDAEGRLIRINNTQLKMQGYTAGELLGQFIWKISANEEATRQNVLALLRGERSAPQNIARIFRRKDGSTFPVMFNARLLRREDGTITGVRSTVQDITEKKRAEEALNYERDLLRTLLDNSPDDIYFKDTQSRFIKASKSQARQFGAASSDAMLGKTDFDFFSEAHARPAFEDEQEIIRTGRPMIAKEEQEVWKDGHVTWASSTKMPLRDPTGKIIGIMGISRDITERKRFEDHLIQSQKMETVSKLAGGIAHEFNSILTVIICQAELLREDLPADSPLAQNATGISQAADRAAILTRQLLAYGRKQFLRPEVLNLNQVITGMSGVLNHLMGGETEAVSIVRAAGLKSVKADAGQIEQVIMNLAMNAHDAMPNGGKLTLETANVTFDPDDAGRYPELKPGGYVMLAISDTGRGMSESVKAHAFEPFFTTKDVGQGTGLGLSTCYGIIKQSGGHINVYSELGRGTTFKIYLPQVEPPPQVPIERLDAPDLPHGTETILLVEDDPALREMAATLLRRLGYTVLAAANGVEALSLKQQPDTGHVDLLLTDVVMPHMSGKELADRVRALFPHTRILFTSAYTENAIVHQGALDKGVALLQKPFTPSALAIKVREALDAPAAPKPEIARKTSGLVTISDEAATPGN